MAEKYDIFISYRRSSFESAQMIATSLKAKGYKVFLDVESLRGGKFNNQLFSVISKCQDFLLVLPAGALDRCSDPQDWVRLEVCHAMTCGKNIIPVMLSGFEWPEPMPFGMDELKMYQAVTAGSNDYYDLTIERLCKYLKSVPSTRKVLNKVLKTCLWVIPTVLLLFGILRAASVPYCNMLGVELLNSLTYVDVLMESNDDLIAELNSFKSVMQFNPRPQRIADAKEDVLSGIEMQKKQVALHITTADGMRKIGPWRFMLLLSRGINPLEMMLEPQLLKMEYDSYIENLEYTALNVQRDDLDTHDIADLIEMYMINNHSFKSSYYQYLAIFCDFPSQTVEALKDCFKSLTAVPTEIVLGLSQKEYEKRAMAENEKTEELIDIANRILDKRFDDVEQINSKVEMLDQMLNNVEAVISGNETK